MCDVYNVSSSLELTMDAVDAFIERGAELPDQIDALERTRRNSKLYITAINSNVNTYTPTAKLVGTIRSRTVVVEEGKPTHDTVHQYQSHHSGWTEPPAEDTLETTTLEYVKFHGDEDAVLRNTALREDMFDVLCTLSAYAHTGQVEGVVVDGETLSPVRYTAENGEVPVELSIRRSTDHKSLDIHSGPETDQTPPEHTSWTSYH